GISFVPRVMTDTLVFSVANLGTNVLEGRCHASGLGDRDARILVAVEDPERRFSNSTGRLRIRIATRIPLSGLSSPDHASANRNVCGKAFGEFLSQPKGSISPHR